jgi:outer membrane protein TolC
MKVSLSKNSFLIVAVLILNIYIPVFTEGQVPEKITLLQALELAGKNYPSVKAKEAVQQASEYHLRSVKDEYIPDLFVQYQDLYASANSIVGTYFSNEGTAIPISGTLKSYSYQGIWSSFGTLMVNWKFFNFGKVKADVSVAKNELKEQLYDYDNEVFQLKIRVADAYLLLIALEQLEKVQEENLARAGSFYQMTRAYSQSGMKAGVDSSVARAELSKANLLLLQSKKNVKVQKLNLMGLMGINNDFNTDTSLFVSKIPFITFPDTSALTNNPLLKLYSNNIDLFQSRAKAVELSYLPSLHLLGAGWARGSGAKYVNNTDVLTSSFSQGIPFEAYNYLVGISFVWNIASAPHIYSEYKSQSLLASAAQYDYNRAYIESKEELNKANLEFEDALEEVKESPVQFRAATDAYNQSKSRYDAGLSTFFEISQALYVLNRAEADQLASYNNLWRALLKQAAATGNLNIFTSNIK